MVAVSKWDLTSLTKTNLEPNSFVAVRRNFYRLRRPRTWLPARGSNSTMDDEHGPSQDLQAILSSIEAEIAKGVQDAELVAVRDELVAQIAVERLGKEQIELKMAKLKELRATVASLEAQEQQAHEQIQQAAELSKVVARRSFTIDLCFMVSLRPEMKPWVDFLARPENVTDIRTTVTGVDKRAIVRWSLFGYPGNADDPFFVVPFTGDTAQWKAGLQGASKEMSSLRPPEGEGDDLPRVFTECLKLEWQGVTRVIIHLSSQADKAPKSDDLLSAASKLASSSINYYCGFIANSTALEETIATIKSAYKQGGKRIDKSLLGRRDDIILYVGYAIRECVGQCRSFAVPVLSPAK